MNRKIWKALGIAVCMLALAAPRAMAKTHEVESEAKFKDAVEAINKSGDTKNEIILTQSFTLKGNYILTNSKTTTIKTTTIKGEGHTIFVEPNAGITVTGKGNVLNLGAEGYKGTLTIDGDTGVAFITVSGEATANMYENVTLQNRMFTGNAYVLVTGSDPDTRSKSVFNMKGGVIEGGSRAVIAQSGATFNMSGGEIRNCKGGSGGGVHVYEATFVMSGGTISGCSASNGGGLCAEKSSTVTITGGTISGCKGLLGGGLYADNSTITINKGTISGCTAVDDGGGLYATNSSKITISDGIISGCKGELGCGLYATNSSEITISGGTISGCTGLQGGGLYANNSTVTITDGTISRCNVGAGGGLYATNSSKITIRGGTISECSTTLDTGKGGGLYAENSTITISGGTIENNKAARGGGVALTDSTVKKDEKPIINWTVVGNKAYKTGGGIWLGEKVEWDISDRTKQIYNNQAIEQGADIFLEGGNSAIKLPIAANMGATYRDSGIKIDNWYKDDNPRYTPSESGQVVEANKLLNGGLSLVASYKASPVHIEIDANGGVGGSGSQTVQKGTTVTLEAPTKEGHLFKGWKDEKGNSYPAGEDGKVNIIATGDVTLTAEWKKLPSAENLPKTGDESPVLLWGAALAVSAAACFMLRRRK